MEFLPVCSSEEKIVEDVNGEEEYLSVYGSMSYLTMLLESSLGVAMYSVGRERRIIILLEDIKVMLQPLQECELNRLVVKTRELVDWSCLSLLLSCHCDISEGMGI